MAFTTAKEYERHILELVELESLKAQMTADHIQQEHAAKAAQAVQILSAAGVPASAIEEARRAGNAGARELERQHDADRNIPQARADRIAARLAGLPDGIYGAQGNPVAAAVARGRARRKPSPLGGIRR